MTQAQWQAVMGYNPSKFKGSTLPVERVSWDDISKPGGFMGMANGRSAAGGVFSLPTEAQWEYACRAGSTTTLNNGKILISKLGACPHLDEVAWYKENSGDETHPVGQKKPNAWGLHDMHGNVFEWCLDYFGTYACDPLVDPRGPTSGSCRVVRGGGWHNGAGICRVANRSCFNPSYSYEYFGLRIARSSIP